MDFKKNIDKILEKFDLLSAQLSTDLSVEERVQKSKEASDLFPVKEKMSELKKAYEEYSDLEEFLKLDDIEIDLKDSIKKELYQVKAKINDLERQVKILLLPKDSADEKNAILEIRAGTGGEEAALFGGVLLRMYNKYAERNKWSFEIMNSSETGKGGIKEAAILVSGKSVFSKLKFESGVHRVQRVPETESNGRVHTSAATIAVLPEAEEVDVEIHDKDLRIDVFRSSGPGGQSVNTTDSAVRIVHLPTGIVVQQQDEKSQHKNKAKALKILRSKLYEAQRAENDAKRAADRREQIGSGDRSERIRTYNFSQGRITDHRINLTLYKIDEITNEGKLDEMINALIAEDEARRLTEVN